MFVGGSDISTPLRRNLHVGLIGEDVRERQALLNALIDTENPLGQSNLPYIEDDGEFGSKTAMRVKEFQSRNNLTIDGVIGPQTDAQMDAIWIAFLRKGRPRSSSGAA
ncbi:MAG TPA: peptidoglycan-binding domain-containing protein [Pyrinomonadaceae bacterium]|jgi:peptidoglycan hydrolase-like protein with peptidoglycan-binding domain